MKRLRSILQRKPKNNQTAKKGQQQPLKAADTTTSGSESAPAAATTAAAVAGQLDIQVKNRTSSGQVYAYVTGQALDNGNKPCFIQSDGKSVYYPTSPPSVGAALTQNVAIKLGAQNSITTITIPHLAGARLWFSIGGQLTFLINPGPALVEPSISNPSDPNINLNWGFCEFTFSNNSIYANISYVDFVSIPIAMSLTPTSGAVQSVAGLKPDGLAQVSAGLQSSTLNDSQDWAKLVIRHNGQILRALSPNNGRVINGGNLFNSYYDGYANRVWQKYTNEDLTVDTQAEWGVVKGRVRNGKLEFPGASFSQPNTGDIFSCSTGPFANNVGITGPLTARISAAFNRSTLLINNVQPTNEKVATFYQDPTTNHYARLVHQANIDGRGYAFPYDDVPAPQDVDQSGFVSGSPKSFLVSVG